MPITLVQTDTAANCLENQYCSANSNNSSQTSRDAISGGTAGVTAVSAQQADVVANRATIGFGSTAPNSTQWESGTWTIRLEVTTSNMNIDSWQFTVCRLNASCTNQATVIADTAGTGDFATTGVKSGSASGSAQTAAPDDVIEVLISPHNSTSMFQNWGWKPSQNIDTPVNQGLPLVTARGMDVREQNAAMFPGLF